MRTYELRKLAENAAELLTDETREIMEAYCDGVNDFVNGISMFGQEQTARALPPEFLIFGITKDSFEPYEPVDILQVGLLTNWDEGNF